MMRFAYLGLFSVTKTSIPEEASGTLEKPRKSRSGLWRFANAYYKSLRKRLEIMVKGFKMKLFEGQEEEYERRHNLLWPEMKDMIHEYGGKNYTIFLDKETLTLFGYIEIEDEDKWAKGADTAINRKWWDYMADIMETNPDNSPVSIDLKTVFHLD